MIKLNLTATTTEEKTVLEHLIPQVSETLAEKINNGVYLEKDGKRLLNKKDLTTFMQYATDQAKKTLEEKQRKGAQTVCVHGNNIMSWAIHYFEEDSIEGKLYNEDGSEYKPITKSKPKSVATSAKAEPQKPKAQQATLFDMLNTTSKNVENNDDDSFDEDDEYIPEQLRDFADEAEENANKPVEKAAKPQDMSGAITVNPIYKRYLDIKKRYQGSVLFLRLGDFYEALGKDAKTVAEPLNLTITGRDFGPDGRVPMVGVPYHAFDNYLTKLIKTGFTVAVAEDINDVTVFPQYDNEEIEELTEEQMRDFDSYVDEETGELLTVSQVTEGVEIEDDGKEILSAEDFNAFDKEALCILSDLFDGEITLV